MRCYILRCFWFAYYYLYLLFVRVIFHLERFVCGFFFLVLIFLSFGWWFGLDGWWGSVFYREWSMWKEVRPHL